MLVACELPWIDPLEAASRLDCAPKWGAMDWVLCYSGSAPPEPSFFAAAQQRSILACIPAERVAGRDFSLLERVLRRDAPPFAHAWFGTLGYGLRHDVERVAAGAPEAISLPPLSMTRYRCVLVFDHAAQSLTAWTDDPAHLEFLRHTAARGAETEAPGAMSLESNLSREAYLAQVEAALGEIRRGAFYQVNLTRKFSGKLARPVSPFGLFRRLCALNPAPYSAFMRTGGVSVLSASPELFLSLDAAGEVAACPIKGTAPRDAADAARDAALKASLAASEKDRAENLMITDLMRNDLARHCVPGSVRVESLCAVESFATVHHMVSTVRARRRPETSPLSLVRGCFPPGSMTGAPKIRAMQWCAAAESVERGVYSGALGWFGGDGSAVLSVVIRTIVLEGGRFEFQVGGGIVADSSPQGEWRETMTKARALAETLGIDLAALEAL